ncbi:hypothetical protein F2Q70_00012265 [Brassica cretica]|uniref:Uncharacterized protein n=1 Tax=Brassica cretica TaxID=69181 RepID=A0A8S9MBY6_BRACR|nr:hypothetical protein F2Q70_00012265 [Brassica cretica]
MVGTINYRSGGIQGPTLVVGTIDHRSRRPWDLYYRRKRHYIYFCKISQPQLPGGKKRRILIRSKAHAAGNTSSREDNTLLIAVARFNAGTTYESLLVPASISQKGITLLQSLVPAGAGLNCKASPCNLWI